MVHSPIVQSNLHVLTHVTARPLAFIAQQNQLFQLQSVHTHDELNALRFPSPTATKFSYPLTPLVGCQSFITSSPRLLAHVPAFAIGKPKCMHAINCPFAVICPPPYSSEIFPYLVTIPFISSMSNSSNISTDRNEYLGIFQREY